MKRKESSMEAREIGNWFVYWLTFEHLGNKNTRVASGWGGLNLSLGRGEGERRPESSLSPPLFFSFCFFFYFPCINKNYGRLNNLTEVDGEAKANTWFDFCYVRSPRFY